MPLYPHIVTNNFEAIIAPTVNDDDTQGYAEGSIWIDTVTQDSYILVECDTAAAVWKIITA